MAMALLLADASLGIAQGQQPPPGRGRPDIPAAPPTGPHPGGPKPDQRPYRGPGYIPGEPGRQPLVQPTQPGRVVPPDAPPGTPPGRPFTPSRETPRQGLLPLLDLKVAEAAPELSPEAQVYTCSIYVNDYNAGNQEIAGYGYLSCGGLTYYQRQSLEIMRCGQFWFGQCLFVQSVGWLRFCDYPAAGFFWCPPGPSPAVSWPLGGGYFFVRNNGQNWATDGGYGSDYDDGPIVQL